MQKIQKSYKSFLGILFKQVNRVKKVKKPIYKYKKLANNTKYKINSKRFNILTKEKQNYIGIMQIGIVKELKHQGIITDDEMLTIIKQLKKKNKLEVEI